MDDENRYPKFLLTGATGMQKYSFVKFQLPMLLFMVIIFTFSSFSKVKAPEIGVHFQDKLYHFIAYTFFGFVVARSFYYQRYSMYIHINYMIWGILFGSFYALSDEVHQYFVPGREMSMGDFIADALGVVFGFIIFRLIIVKKKNTDS